MLRPKRSTRRRPAPFFLLIGGAGCVFHSGRGCAFVFLLFPLIFPFSHQYWMCGCNSTFTSGRTRGACGVLCALLSAGCMSEGYATSWYHDFLLYARVHLCATVGRSGTPCHVFFVQSDTVCRRWTSHAIILSHHVRWPRRHRRPPERRDFGPDAPSSAQQTHAPSLPRSQPARCGRESACAARHRWYASTAPSPPPLGDMVGSALAQCKAAQAISGAPRFRPPHGAAWVRRGHRRSVGAACARTRGGWTPVVHSGGCTQCAGGRLAVHWGTNAGRGGSGWWKGVVPVRACSLSPSTPVT